MYDLRNGDIPETDDELYEMLESGIECDCTESPQLYPEGCDCDLIR